MDWSCSNLWLIILGIYLGKWVIKRKQKKDGIENLCSDVNYSCRNGFEYHELKDMYGCYNDYHRQYEYWNWKEIN